MPLESYQPALSPAVRAHAAQGLSWSGLVGKDPARAVVEIASRTLRRRGTIAQVSKLARKRVPPVGDSEPYRAWR